jgi:hypothetical protein
VDIPPREAFADYARQLVEGRTDWDGLHEFHSIVWDDGCLTPRTIGMIDPGIDPGMYPKLMQELAYEAIEKDVRPDAYALLIEAHAVESVGRDAQLEADFAARRVYQRPDAIEVADALVADVRGRVWFARIRRDGKDGIAEWCASLGSGRLGGQLTRGLVTVACSTGVLVHGLPMPTPAWRQN